MPLSHGPPIGWLAGRLAGRLAQSDKPVRAVEAYARSPPRVDLSDAEWGSGKKVATRGGKLDVLAALRYEMWIGKCKGTGMGLGILVGVQEARREQTGSIAARAAQPGA